jgi:hypothetical protein
MSAGGQAIGGAIEFGCGEQSYCFTEPRPYPGEPAKAPGIFAILVEDENCKPRPLRVLFFGDTNDFSGCLTPRNSYYKDWLRKARSRPLLVALYPLPGNEVRRRTLLGSLIAAHQPICNRWC